jgi:hypothetical protein
MMVKLKKKMSATVQASGRDAAIVRLVSTGLGLNVNVVESAVRFMCSKSSSQFNQKCEH